MDKTNCLMCNVYITHIKTGGNCLSVEKNPDIIQMSSLGGIRVLYPSFRSEDGVCRFLIGKKIEKFFNFFSSAEK